MPKYFLNQIYEGEYIPDPEGADFTDLAAARDEAIIAARQIMANRLMKGEKLDHSSFEIRTENGQLALELLFSDALP